MNLTGRLDITGDTYGFLKVISFAGVEKGTQNRSMWNCECLRCGSVKKYPLGNLRSGGSKQCLQCAHKFRNRNNCTHGRSHTRIYYIWRTLSQYEDWPETWAKFIDFHKDVGDPPEDKPFLVKKTPKRPFGKDNFMWHDRRRHVEEVQVNGSALSIQEWAEKLAVSRAAIYTRITKGDTPEQAVGHFKNLYSKRITIAGIRRPLCEWANEFGVKSSRFKQKIDKGNSVVEALRTLKVRNLTKRIEALEGA